jgi:hypothetical protein
MRTYDSSIPPNYRARHFYKCLFPARSYWDEDNQNGKPETVFLGLKAAIKLPPKTHGKLNK